MLVASVSGWDLTSVDLCGPYLAGVKTCVGTSDSVGTYSAVTSVIILGYCGMPGSPISKTYGDS